MEWKSCIVGISMIDDFHPTSSTNIHWQLNFRRFFLSVWLEGRKGLRGCGTLRYRGHNETPSDTEPCGTKLMMVHSDTPKNFGTTNFWTTNVRTTRSEATNLGSDQPQKRQTSEAANVSGLGSHKSPKKARKTSDATLNYNIQVWSMWYITFSNKTWGGIFQNHGF